MTASFLDQLVLGRHYFDPKGLILSLDEQGQPNGFVHAGFGPNEERTGLDHSPGCIYMLMVERSQWPTDLPDQLLAQGEQYLWDRGAKVLYAGGIRPLNGFYLGLYGGSELPGVLLSDQHLTAVLLRNGYRERGRVVVLQRDLVRFRPIITRDQRLIAREAMLEVTYAPPCQDWWESCVMGGLERHRFQLLRKADSSVLAEAWFWDVEPLASSWGLRTAGMYDLGVRADLRRRGYATYLLTESFRELHRRGITLVESQTMLSNQPAIEFYRKLGFAPVDHGLMLRREPRNP